MKPAALDVKYVALSYVWGQLPMYRLQRDNFELLSTQGSLEHIRKDLPRTINDAIDFVRAMDLRYLWVDGLCLVQDDEDDVALGIEQMNSIYHGSYFTIVAASGADANAGLPGIGSADYSARNSWQVVKDVAPGLQMTVLHSIDWHLKRSTHSQRGWTLQELVLPRRTVVFTRGEGVYFRCQEANWSEDSWADRWGTRWMDADDSNVSRVPDPADGCLPSLWAYQKLCEDYSRRSLRSDGDTLRAVAGISRPLAAGMATRMVEGLPGYYLDHFLLFVSDAGNLRRRPEFASFSWAGWRGSIMWPRENCVRYDNADDDGGDRSRGGGEGDSGRKKRQPRMVWETANIITWLKHCRLVDWNALDESAQLDSLSYQPWDRPSLLVQLMRQYPGVFPEAADVDPARQYGAYPSYFSSSGSRGSVPIWDRVSDVLGQDTDNNGNRHDAAARRLKRAQGFSIDRFDLVNGQAEFERTVARLEDRRERLAVYNWIAQRRFRKFPYHTRGRRLWFYLLGM